VVQKNLILMNLVPESIVQMNLVEILVQKNLVEMNLVKILLQKNVVQCLLQRCMSSRGHLISLLVPKQMAADRTR